MMQPVDDLEDARRSLRPRQPERQESSQSVNRPAGYSPLGFSSRSLEVDKENEIHFDDVDSTEGSESSEEAQYQEMYDTPPGSINEESPQTSPLSFRSLKKISKANLEFFDTPPPTERGRCIRTAWDAFYAFVFVTKGVLLLVIICFISYTSFANHHHHHVPMREPQHHVSHLTLVKTTSDEELEDMKQAMILAQFDLRREHGEVESEVASTAREGNTLDATVLPNQESQEDKSKSHWEAVEDGNDQQDPPAVDGMRLTGSVERVCDDEGHADTFDVDACFQICQPSACCFNPDVPCNGSLVGCEPYMYCDVLLDLTDFAASGDANV